MADSFTLDDLKKAQGESFTLQDLNKAAPEKVRSAAYQQGRAESNPLFRGLANVVQGPTLGFGDEIVGGLLAVPIALRQGRGVGESYRAMRDYIRGSQDQYKEDFPIAAPVTQVAAAAPMLVQNTIGNAAKGAFAAAAPQTAARISAAVQAPRVGMAALGTRMAVGGATGAGYGAITGLGDSIAEDPLGMALDTGKGALVSGALGAATPAVGSVAMGGYNRIAPYISNTAAVNYAKQKVAEALARDARGAVFESGASNAGSQAAARFAKLGPEARVADAAGQNTKQLLDTVATLPGRTKNLAEAAIRERQAGRAGRLIEAADDALGANGQRMAQSVETWVASREMQARPLYRQLHRVQITPSDELRSIVSAADQLGATRVAQDISTAKQLPYTLDLASPSRWSMRDLDHVKQGLDTIISKKWDREAGKYTPEGEALIQLKNNLTRTLDRLTTNSRGESLYRSARDAFAGPSQLVDAAKQGRNAFLKDDASIRQAMEGLSASELEAFRLGAFESLRAKLGKMDGQTQIMKMWREPATQERLKALFGNERSYREFAVKAAQEARLQGLESVGRGSMTSARHYGAGDLDVAPLAEAAASVVKGPSVGTLAALGTAWNRVKTPEPVRDEIGSVLLSRNPNVMRELEQLTPLLTAERNRRAQTAGGFAGLLNNF